MEKINYDTVIITCKLSIFLFFKFKGKKVFLIKTYSHKDSFKRVTGSVDVLKGQQSIAFAGDVYASVLNTLNKLDIELDFKLFCVWNGATTCDIAVTDFARQHHRKLLFFEIANLPGKIFVDPKGVNARSYLNTDISVLDRFFIDEKAFDYWLDNTFFKEKIHPPKQARLIKKINYFALVDRFGLYFLCVQCIDQTSIKDQFKRFAKSKKPTLQYDDFELNKPFVFLPLQVCSDTQLLLNSDIDNEQALEIAKKEADILGLPLLVKPHPAENNICFLNEIYRLREIHGFYLVSFNTIDLLKYAELVVVINSTVGLEAMILDKKVKILGRALYAQFTRNRLISYIQNFLLDCDYFENQKKPLPVSFARACLARADLIQH